MLVVGAGKYRSRQLEVPASLTVPSKSMVRLALSNALMDKIPGAEVLDLFAGSGALGIEALSRGAKHAMFVDNAPEAAQVVTKNLAMLKETAGEVRQMDYQSALSLFAKEGRRFDIVFLDPPYAMKTIYSEVPAFLLDHDLLAFGGAVVLEYEGEIEAPVSRFGFAKTYNYGRTHVLILRR